MSTYIIFSMGKSKYRVEAYFYDVDKNFMNFYDEDDNLIGSINVDEIDCVLDKEHADKFHLIETVDEEECAECEDTECECHPYNFKDKSKYSGTLTLKPTNKEKSDINFDELFKRVLGLHGEK